MPTKSLKLSVGSFVSFLFILLAYWYKKSQDCSLRVRVDQTHDALVLIEQKVSVDPTTKIAVGYGSCLDVVVQSKDVILDHFSPPDTVKHFDSISSEEELQKVFAYFFKHGAAAERYVANSSLFQTLVKLSLKSESVRKSVGGNAPVMASRFAKEGIGEVLLGTQMSEELRKMMPFDMKISGPVTKTDDIHLLLEYPAGESWGHLTAPRANRLIVHNDAQNPLIMAMESFHEDLIKFNANLLVIGGLQMMDNFPSSHETRQSRLGKLRQSLIDLKKVNNKIKIHFEMASFSDQSLMQDVINLLLPHVDSVGMNEQELPNLLNVLSSGNITLVSDAYPRVASVLDQMRDVYEHLYVLSKGQLSRIHVHTLAFQAILTRKDANWKNSLTAAAKAALTAHRHTCGSDLIDTEKAKLIMDESFTTSKNGPEKHRIPFDAKHPVACWQESASWNRHATTICVAPVLVCTKVLQTGGGGDNISAAGLVLQV